MEQNMIANAAQAAMKPKTARGQLQDLIISMKGEISRALPSVLTPERFCRIVCSAVSTTPQLAQCTRESFLGAMMTAAQLGMEPNTPLGQAYLLPYYNRKKGCYEVQFQLGYKGMLDLAYRSGEVLTVQAHEVCEHDEFSYAFGLVPSLTHVPALGDRGNVICYYAMWQGKNGGYGFEVMSLEQVRAHAQRYSKAAESGPWKTNFDEMAKKTVLKRALKYAPVRSDFVQAITGDEGVRNIDRAQADAVLDVTPEFAEEEPVVDGATGEVVEVADAE